MHRFNFILTPHSSELFVLVVITFKCTLYGNVMHSDAIVFLFYKMIADLPNFCKLQTGWPYFTPQLLIH